MIQKDLSEKLEALEVFLGNSSRSGIHWQSHVADLLVDILHECNDEINKLVLVHAFSVCVGNQETDVIALVH